MRIAKTPRQFGIWICTALVVGNMIGSGIFLLPASLAPYGFNSVIAWLLTATGAIFLAMVFAGLSRAFPSADGPYAYTRMAFGELPAFMLAWAYWISVWVGNAAIATGTVSYLSHLLPSIQYKTGISAICTVALIWLLTALNVVGARAAGWFQVVTTILKVLPLLAIAILGIYLVADGDDRIIWSASDAPPLTLDAITAAATLTLWALLGLESAAVTAERVIDPERNIPRATIIGTVITAIIYIFACTTVLMLTPAQQLAQSTAPFADIAALFWGNWAGYWLALFAVISGIGALNGWIFLQGELPAQMARTGLFPTIFGKLSSRQTPTIALCFTSTLVTTLVLMHYRQSMAQVFTFMILLSTTATLVMYLLCSLAALKLMRSGELIAHGHYARWLTTVAAMGAIYAIWTLVGAGKEAVLWGFVLLTLAIPLYYAMRWHKKSAVSLR